MGDRRSISGRVGQDEDPADRSGPPTALPAQQLRYDSHLPIERAEHVLDVDHTGLDLDEDDDRPLITPREDVDAPAFAVTIEGELDLARPAHLAESSDDDLDDGRVAGVEQLIRICAPVAWFKVQVDPQRSGDPAGRTEADPLDLADLEQRDQLLTRPAGATDVKLALTTTHPDGPEEGSDPHVVHEA